MNQLLADLAHVIAGLAVLSLPVDTIQLLLLLIVLMLLGVAIGTVAVLAGVGGGVLFVPLATALLPIHVDFVRGAGLMVALVGAISAAPRLLSLRYARLEIAVPFALCSSVGSIVGARVGFLVPTDALLIVLGSFMLLIAVQTAVSARRSARSCDNDDDDDEAVGPATGSLSDRLAQRWELSGTFRDDGVGAVHEWRARRIVPAMGGFVGIGGIGGMLGVGAGWANVPMLHGVVGLPLKVAAATSGLIIVANASAAAWVYLSRGALQPLIVGPALVGMVAGTRLGTRLLSRASGATIRLLVIVLLGLTGVRTLVGVLM